MAPEVVRVLFSVNGGLAAQGVAAAYTSKADIWSLGMVLYELVECQVPYADVGQWDVKAFIAKGVAPRFTNVDAGYVSIVTIVRVAAEI